MGIIIRQSLKTTIISYLGIIIGTFNILWLAPKLLNAEEIGLNRILTDLSLLIASIVQLGAGNIVDKFFPYFRDEKSRHHGFFLFLLLYPIIGFLIFLIFFFGFDYLWIEAYKDKSPLLLNFYLHILPLTFFVMYTIVLEAYIRGHLRTVFASFIRDVFSRVAFTIIVCLYYFKIVDLNGFVLLLILSYFLSALCLLWYIKKLGILYLDFNKSFFQKSLLKDMLIFSMFIMLGGAGSLIASKIDTLMLGSMKGLALTGVYAIAFYIGSIIEVPRKAISQISTPLIAQSWKNNDHTQILTIYRKSAINGFIIAGFLFLLVWGNVDSLISLIPNSSIYAQGKYVILFIALGKLVNMGTGMSGEIILTSSHYYFYLISIAVLGVLSFVTNYLFIPVYGINGAAFTTLFCIFIFNLLNYLFLYFKFKLQPFNIQIGKVVLIFGLTFFISFINLFDNSFFWSAIFNICFKSLLISVVFISLVYYLKVSEDLNEVLNGVFRKFKSFMP